ncbi:hypothetical protein BDA96_05G234800 [Sorghum bicolor]|uniref:Cytochrome P450 n=1 Tax=Sorghum bicolor TaxID=4558 RepID=A0A921R279_SORBI|nr:hypothetical protein BDA96_05G234800 [Sorghum bicolor]
MHVSIYLYTRRETLFAPGVQLSAIEYQNVGNIMEVFFLMAGLALVVFIAIFRRTSSRSVRALPAVPNIEVRDRAIARSMLVDHADTFSDRPVSPFHVKFVRAERVNLSYSISTVPHGPLWRALRCNLTAGILHPSRLGRLAGLQRQAVDGLVAGLSSGCGHDDDVVVIRDGLHTAVLTLQMRMCFGDGGFDAGDVRAVQRVLKDFFDGMVDAPVLATSRTARLLHWRRWRRFLAVRSRMTKLLLPLIMERQRRRQSMSLCCSDSGDDGGGGGGIRPYVDSLLDLHVPSYDDGSVRRALTDDEKANLVWEFLGAGTETVVSCVEWALAHLVNQPEVQEKLRRDVHVHGGGSDTPTPYLRAVILESLRLHPPVAVIQRDVVVSSVDGGGAADQAVIIGVHVPPPAPEEEEEDGSSGAVRFTIVPGAIGRDSRTWTDAADEFRPERFLAGGEGEAVGPMPGPKDVRMLPFGAGTRHCPGMALGMAHVSLLLAALWETPAAATGALVDLTEVDGFVKHMKTPLRARITPRM